MSNIEKLAEYICEHCSDPKAATDALIALLADGRANPSAEGGDAA